MTGKTNIQVEAPERFSFRRAAQAWGLHRHTVSSWAKKGFIRTTKLPNGRYQITREEVERVRDLLSGKTGS